MGILLTAMLTLPEDNLDLDKLFKEAKWEQIEDVLDKGYEVEKVTMVAGVRGNEAEDEILNYLYYLIDTKTGEKSIKIDTPQYIYHFCIKTPYTGKISPNNTTLTPYLYNYFTIYFKNTCFSYFFVSKFN